MADTTFVSGTLIESSWLNPINDHVYDTSLTSVHTATQLTNVPAGTISATNVQAAINELDSTITTLDTDLSADITAVGNFIQAGTGAVTRTVQNKLRDHVSALDFGLATSNTGAQNVTAINSAIAYAITRGGLVIHIPAGTYDFNATINTAGADDLRITGDGPDATILRITSASANFISATGHTRHQTYDNFTLTSTVTRDSSSHMMLLGTGSSGLWMRGLIHRVKVSKHYYGIVLQGFEQSTLSEVYIVDPTGAGTALVAGVYSGSNQGANLNLFNCFLRGFDDVTQAQPPTGLVGLQIKDVEAVFGVNCDIGNFLNQAVLIDPQTRAANCHFVQCFFDGTKEGDNMLVTGTGIKQQFRFTGCWWNGAGNMTSGADDCSGLNFQGAGEYYDWNVTGGGFLSTSGPGIYSVSPYLDMVVCGVSFTNCGFNASSSLRDAIHFAPTSTSLKHPTITGCKFQDSGGQDIAITANAINVAINGCQLEKGLSIPDGTLLGNCKGNVDPSHSPVGASVASASTIIVPATYDYVIVTGSASVNKIQVTYPGHILAIRSTGTATFVDDAGGGNLRLNGNFATSSNSILTLVCEGNGDWREITRLTP